MDKAPRPHAPVTACEIALLQSITLPYRYTGHQESSRGQMLPVYRVRAWRTANEDDTLRPYPLDPLDPASRWFDPVPYLDAHGRLSLLGVAQIMAVAESAVSPLYKHFDGKWRTYPIPQPECLRCYPRCGLQIGHPKP